MRCILEFDSQTLISGSSDSTVKVWNMETRKCSRTFRGHADAVTCVIKVNDKRIASGSKECMATLHGHTNWIEHTEDNQSKMKEWLDLANFRFNQFYSNSIDLNACKCRNSSMLYS